MKLTKEKAKAYEIVNSTTLLTKLPSLDPTISSFPGAKMGDTVFRKFTVSHTFGPETTQFQLFEEVIQQKMVDFLAGRNATVMTYGTTNSGKSYTLQGTTTSPGIIPRGLEFVFSNINTRPTPSYKPTHNSDVVSLSPVDRAEELEAKNKLLTFASVDKRAYINAYKQMQKLLQEESPIRPGQASDAHYSVWVSFAEIYNENIYDLLSNDCPKRRPLLKLGTDSRGQAFIKEFEEVVGRGEGGVHPNNNGRRGNGAPPEGAGRMCDRQSGKHRRLEGARRSGERLSRGKYQGEGDPRGTRESTVESSARSREEGGNNAGKIDRIREHRSAIEGEDRRLGELDYAPERKVRFHDNFRRSHIRRVENKRGDILRVRRRFVDRPTKKIASRWSNHKN